MANTPERRKKETTVEATLRIARELQPDLWKRTEQVARIIDPAAFDEDWIIQPASAAKLHALKLNMMRANAIAKAQDVLKVLGVNTDADWYEILDRLVKEPVHGD